MLERHPELIGRLHVRANRGALAFRTRGVSELRSTGAHRGNAHQPSLRESGPSANRANTVDAPNAIALLIEHHDKQSVFTHYRACDVCVVTSLHDGMNLVAKEFVAARDDETGRADPVGLRRRVARVARGVDRQSRTTSSIRPT